MFSRFLSLYLYPLKKLKEEHPDAKALLIDRVELKKAQLEGNVLAANDIFMDAYNTDVRPLLGEMRNELGLDADPMKAYLASGYGAKIAAERVGGAQAGWGA
mgnify:CR=1 FL=1